MNNWVNLEGIDPYRNEPTYLDYADGWMALAKWIVYNDLYGKKRKRPDYSVENILALYNIHPREEKLQEEVDLNTEFQIACGEGNAEKLIMMLLESDIDVNADNKLALRWAVYNKNWEIVDIIKEY